MNTITGRLTLGYATIVSLTVLLAVIWGSYYTRKAYIDGVDLLNDAEYKEIEELIQEHASHSENVFTEIKKHSELDVSLFYFQLRKSDNTILFKSTNLGVYEITTHLQSTETTNRMTYNHDKLGLIRIASYHCQGYLVDIASSLNGLEAMMGRFKQAAIAVVMISFLGSLAMGYIMSQFVLKPIRRIQRISQKINSEDMSLRIPVANRKDEFGELSTFLNQMFDRLENSFKQIVQFTGDASHQLRTPLALIRLQAEKLRNGIPQGDENRTCIEEMMEELDGMNKLIDDLLFLAKADSGVFKMDKKSEDLTTFLKDFSEDANILCEDKDLHYSLNIKSGTALHAKVDAMWLRHALLNILNNAILVSPPKGMIQLTLLQIGDQATMTLEDEGPGISEDKLGTIFDRFVRNQNADMHYQGTGLGLSICQSIMYLNGGSIRAANKSSGGLRVEISIPIH
jgi:signal transduction histidine kinase